MAMFKGLNCFSLGVPTLILPATLILQSPGPSTDSLSEKSTRSRPGAGLVNIPKNELENGGLMVV